MSDWLEVRIPISPRDDYFNRVRLIAHSIRSLGGRYADVRIRVTVGADREPEDLHARLPWSRAAGIDWVWVDRAEFRHWKNTRHKYMATLMERFRPPFSTRHVLMLDADVLAIRKFDELSTLLDAGPGVAAVMAHRSPFDSPGSEHLKGWRRMLKSVGIEMPRKGLGHLEGWRRMFKSVGIEMPPLSYEHSGWDVMERDSARRFGPPYFNTGVLLGSAAVLDTLYLPYMRALDAVRATINSYYFEQIALTLAMLQTKLPFHVLPLRYNFPNQPEFDRASPNELENICFLHFLRSDTVRRVSDFETIEMVAKLAARADLHGSNETLRRRVAELLHFMTVDRSNATTVGM